MAVVFGTSSKGKATVIHRNFEYVKERDNHCGTTSWRCQKFQSMQCKAHLLISGDRIVSDHQPEHTHSGNVATALARKAGNNLDKLHHTRSAAYSLFSRTCSAE